MTNEPRYQKSALGDFYIQMFGTPEDHKIYGSCCTAGGAPHLTTPQLCAFDEFEDRRYCYVKVQPQNDYEIYQIIEAAWASEFRCLRYSGHDKEIIQRLADIGIANEVCDNPLPEGLLYKLRNYCTFKESVQTQLSAESLASSLRNYLLNIQEQPSNRIQATELKQISDNSITFSYTWTANLDFMPVPIFHIINVQSWHTDFSNWLITHSLIEQKGSIGISLSIDDFLRKSKGFTNLRWHSESEWQNGVSNFWRNTPY